jgi:hypothetical protein
LLDGLSLGFIDGCRSYQVTGIAKLLAVAVKRHMTLSINLLGIKNSDRIELQNNLFLAYCKIPAWKAAKINKTKYISANCSRSGGGYSEKIGYLFPCQAETNVVINSRANRKIYLQLHSSDDGSIRILQPPPPSSSSYTKNT